MPKLLFARTLLVSGGALLCVCGFGAQVAAADETKPAPAKPAPAARPAAPAAPVGIHPPSGPAAPGFHPPGPGPMPTAHPGQPPSPSVHPMPGTGPTQAGSWHGSPHPGGPSGAYAHREFRSHDFRHFSGDEQRVWAGGSWHQDWHDGRYGWWWYTNGGWYFYDEPVYPMPLFVSDVYVADPGYAAPVEDAPDEAPPPYPQPYPQPYPAPYPPPAPVPPPQQLWYYCDNPPGYYPYVQSCPTQFRPVPAGQR
jgi:hypothetical protein